MNAIASQQPSLILALHARYEKAWEEYNHVDSHQGPRPAAGGETREQWIEWNRAEEGKRANSAETDRLRLAILYQVPDTDEELTILLFHLWTLYDPARELDAEEKSAVEVGLISAFDYQVTEGRGDMGDLGDQFRTGAMLCFHKRRCRTGIVEA